MKRIVSCLIPLFFSLHTPLTAQETLRAYQREAFVQANGDTLLYRILLPIDYDCSRRYPLLVFLHGSGERGRDNEAQLKHGGSLFLQQEVRKQFQAIVVFPQCPAGEAWSGMERDADGRWDLPLTQEPTRQMRLLSGLLTELLNTHCVNSQRVYLGGLSLGAFGTLEWLAREPRRFAAAFPICGGGNRLLTPIYGRQVPTWFFHGAADPVVPVQASRELVEKIGAEGGNVRYTEYPAVGHDSWNLAFQEPDLLPWLLRQHVVGEDGWKRPISSTPANMRTLTYFSDGKEKLDLDLYLPENSDTSRQLPLVLYVHGGGFSGGSRLDPGIARMGNEMTQAGFAFASIAYRLLMRGKSFGCDQSASQKVIVFQQSVVDVRRATAFLMAQREAYRLDMNRVVLAGSSAGAEAVLHTAYWPQANLPAEAFVLPKDFRFAGLISMAGALIDPMLIQPENAPPTLFFHGTCDALVPFDIRSHRLCAPGQPGYLLLHGAGELGKRHRALQLPFYMVAYENGGHEYASLPMEEERERMLDFIRRDVLGGEKRQLYVQQSLQKACPYPTHFEGLIRPR